MPAVLLAMTAAATNMKKHSLECAFISGLTFSYRPTFITASAGVIGSIVGGMPR